jgi:predicted DNA-binding transcriptional regulator YafY
MRDLHDAPIDYDRAKKSYYYSEKSYKLPLISMSESDLFAIAIAEKTLKEHEGTPIYEKLRRIFFKLGQYLPEKVSLESAWVDSKISVNPGRHTNIRPDIWTDVTRALQNNRTLKISYQKPTAEKANFRKIDPYHVVSYQGDWYLIGYCHYRDDIRTFSISRIKKISILDNSFRIPADFDYKEAWKNCFGIFQGEKDTDVVIKFSPESAPYVKEREWHPTQNLKERKDGTVILKLTTNHLDEIKRWVLFWGNGAEVIEPPEFRRLVQNELKGALAAYDN